MNNWRREKCFAMSFNRNVLLSFFLSLVLCVFVRAFSRIFLEWKTENPFSELCVREAFSRMRSLNSRRVRSAQRKYPKRIFKLKVDPLKAPSNFPFPCREFSFRSLLWVCVCVCELLYCCSFSFITSHFLLTQLCSFSVLDCRHFVELLNSTTRRFFLQRLPLK